MSDKPPPTNPHYGGGEGSEAPPPYPGPPAPGYDPKNYDMNGPQHPQQPLYPTQGAYPNPPVYTQQPQGGEGMNTVTVVVAHAAEFLGPYPVNMSCPKCSAQIVTRVEYESGLLAWLLCGGLALFGCIYGCCLIPFCVDSCKNAVHSCPNCNQFIGAHRRL